MAFPNKRSALPFILNYSTLLEALVSTPYKAADPQTPCSLQSLNDRAKFNLITFGLRAK